MPHSRTETEQDDIALRILSGCQYKVLRALVNRADPRGICFPGEEYLSGATGYNRRHVSRALEALESHFVIQYHRRNEWDNFTRRKLPNVMQINPDYISLAQEFEPEAREMWATLIQKCGNDSMRLWSHNITNTNDQLQNQHQVPSSREATTTNQPAAKRNGRRAAPDEQPAGKTKGKNPEGGPGQRAARNNQREAHPPESPVPPARQGFVNPKPIDVNIPDKFHEQLAADIRQLGISMSLARGFVLEYGYDRAKVALDETLEMGSKADNPAGLFRTILQSRLADDFAVSKQMLNNMRKQ